ncbi:MAG: hypothetical protein AAF340_16840 [Pseudomonadota bacterium]
MFEVVKTFLKDESGATVVDMTMLMAALVGLCLAVTVQVTNGMDNQTEDLSTTLIDRPVGAAW